MKQTVNHIGIYVEGTKKTLLAEIRRCKKVIEVEGIILAPNKPLLGITCQKCGKIYNYGNEKDIPSRSIKCVCGEWIIKYVKSK